jgi:site-specific recombinase XerD
MALEPIDPETALELYLADRKNELSEATLYSHRSRLGHFVRWCDEQDIENLNNLTGRQLHRYRLWRREEGDLSIASEKTQMDTLRVMVRWLEQIDGVEQDLSTKVRSPSLTPEQNTRHVMLNSEQATKVLSYLEKYEYATFGHVRHCLVESV